MFEIRLVVEPCITTRLSLFFFCPFFVLKTLLFEVKIRLFGLFMKMHDYNTALKIKKSVIGIKLDRQNTFKTAAPDPLASIPITNKEKAKISWVNKAYISLILKQQTCLTSLPFSMDFPTHLIFLSQNVFFPLHNFPLRSFVSVCSLMWLLRLLHLLGPFWSHVCFQRHTSITLSTTKSLGKWNTITCL